LKTRISTVISRYLVAIGMASLPWAAQAIDLGTLHWKVQAGQAAYAEIELRDKGPITIQTVRAALASREAYAAAGLTYQPGFISLRTSILPDKDGQALLKIDQLPQDVESLDLLVVVNDRLAVTLAEYRIDTRRGSHDLASSPAGTLQLKTRATAVSKQAKNATSTTPPTAQANQDETGARNALQAWAQAWSQRNVDAYVAAYTSDFSGAQTTTHETWLEQRRSRILARNNIAVELSNIRLEHKGKTFVATFDQRYRSDGLSDRMRKQVVLVQDKGHWLIQRETALPSRKAKTAAVETTVSQE
jgi:hypothetical protein